MHTSTRGHRSFTHLRAATRYTMRFRTSVAMVCVRTDPSRVDRRRRHYRRQHKTPNFKIPVIFAITPHGTTAIMTPAGTVRIKDVLPVSAVFLCVLGVDCSSSVGHLLSCARGYTSPVPTKLGVFGMHAFHQSVHHVFLKKGRLADIRVMKLAD